MEKGKEEKKRGIDLPILLSKVRVALPACWDEGKLVLSHSVGLLTDMERERKIRESPIQWERKIITGPGSTS